jgi:alpha-glucosidase
MVADYPTAYEGQPGFEFIQIVPTWWDETRVLAGKIGEVLVTARRKGKAWYIGGIAAEPACDLDLPLSFLGQGRYRAQVWKDAPDADLEPNHLVTESLNLSARESLRIHLNRDGGFVAQLTPTP